MINGTLQLTRLTNESAEYVARREELRLAEIELMRQRERVAAMRRLLPPGAVVHDYVFQEGPANLDADDAPITAVRLSDLFTGPNRSVVIYHLMYGKRQATPCPMCSMWIDGYNGVGRHIAQNVDFAIAAAADPFRLRQHARNRGWRNLRLLSCGDSTFKYDLRRPDATKPIPAVPNIRLQNRVKLFPSRACLRDVVADFMRHFLLPGTIELLDGVFEVRHVTFDDGMFLSHAITPFSSGTGPPPAPDRPTHVPVLQAVAALAWSVGSVRSFAAKCSTGVAAHC